MIQFLLSLFKRTHENVDAPTFESLIKQSPDAVVIDVRTPGEYASGTIKGSTLIPVTDPKFGQKLAEFGDKPVFLFCQSGGRSALAAKKAFVAGCRTLYNLEGGILSWNGPTEKPKRR